MIQKSEWVNEWLFAVDPNNEYVPIRLLGWPSYIIHNDLFSGEKTLLLC